MENGYKNRMIGKGQGSFAMLLLVSMLGCSGSRYLRDVDLGPASKETRFLQPERITAGLEANFLPNLSPNGNYVFYTSDRTENKDLWEKKSSGDYPKRLTYHPADDFEPVMSPDGDKLAFVSRRNDAAGDIHVLELGTSVKGLIGGEEGNVDRIKLEKSSEFGPAWFPDSTKIVFVSRRSGEIVPRIMMAELGGGKPHQIGDLRGEQPEISPDGRYLVFTRSRNLYLYDLEENKETPLTSNRRIANGQPSFSPDGKRIVLLRFTDDSNGDGAIDGNDHPTIWDFDLDKVKSSKGSISQVYRPLTTAIAGVGSPDLKPPFVYFVAKAADSIDIFRISSEGQFSSRGDYAMDRSALDSTVKDADQLFYLRRLEHEYYEKDKDISAELALRELDILAEEGHLASAMWTYHRILNAYNDPQVRNLAEIVKFELEIRDLFIERRSVEPSSQHLRTLRRSLRKAKKRLKRLEESQDLLAIARLSLTIAKINAALKNYEIASQSLSALLSQRRNQDLKEILSHVGMYKYKLHIYLNQTNEAVETLYDLLSFSSSFSAQRQVATALVKTALVSGDEVQSLSAYKVKFGDHPEVSARLQLELARLHNDNGNRSLAINEYVDLLLNFDVSYEIFSQALTRADLLLSEARRFSELESLYSLMSKKPLKSPYLGVVEKFTQNYNLRKAARFRSERNFDGAEEVYNLVVKLNPDSLLGHVGVVDIAKDTNRLDEVTESYENYYNDKPSSAVRAFTFGYCRFLALDSIATIPDRIDHLDDVIELVETARQKRAQDSSVHMLLGDLYFKRYDLNQKYEESQSWSSAIHRKWLLTKQFFGVVAPPWQELALDSYLSAYFLSDEDAPSRLIATEKLAETFFALRSYSKSLYYAMKRLQRRSQLPFKSPGDELAFLRLAARAGYYSEDLKEAAAIQTEAIRLWELSGDKQGMAEALDRFALILRMLKRYADAQRIYERLLPLQEELNNRENRIHTAMNLGYVAWKAGDEARALKALQIAESKLGKIVLKDGDDKSSESIGISLAGEESLVDGFDNFSRKTFILSIKADVYKSQGLFGLAVETLDRKLALLGKKRQYLIDEQGKDKRALAEEIGVAWNHRAQMLLFAGKYTEAANSYLRAMEFARFKRPDNRRIESKAELINILAYYKVQALRKELGLISGEQQTKVENELDGLIVRLKGAYDSGEVGLAVEIGQLYSFLARIRGGERKQLLLASNEFLQKSGKNVEDFLDTNFQIGLSADKSTSSFGLSQFVQRRRRALGESRSGWRTLARLGQMELAWRDLQEYINAGGVIESIGGRQLAYIVLETWLNRQAGKGFLDIAIAQRLLFKELANRIIGEDESFGMSGLEGIESNECVLAVHKQRNGVYLHSLNKSGNALLGRSKTISSVVSDHAAEIENCNRIYLALSGGTALEPWFKPLERFDVSSSIVPFPEYAAYLEKKRKRALYSVTLLGPDESKLRPIHGKRFEHVSDFQKGIPKSNVLHVGGRLILNAVSPTFSVVSLGSEGSFELGRIFERSSEYRPLYVFPRVEIESGDVTSELSSDDAVSAIAIWLLQSQGLSAVLQTNANKANWKKFYSAVDKNSLAKAATTHLDGAITIGYMGLLAREKKAYADQVVDELIASASESLNSAKYTQAVLNYEEALYFSQLAARPKVAQKLLERLIYALFLKQDFSEALQYQEKILASAPEGSIASGDFVKAQSLAIKVGDFDRAEELDAEINPSTLSPVLALEFGKNRAAMLARQKRYREAEEVLLSLESVALRNNLDSQFIEISQLMVDLRADHLLPWDEFVKRYPLGEKMDIALVVLLMRHYMSRGFFVEVRPYIDRFKIDSKNLASKNPQLWFKGQELLVQYLCAIREFSEARSLLGIVFDELDGVGSEGARLALFNRLNLRVLFLSASRKEWEGFLAKERARLRKSGESRAYRDLELELARLNYGGGRFDRALAHLRHAGSLGVDANVEGQCIEKQIKERLGLNASELTAEVIERFDTLRSKAWRYRCALVVHKDSPELLKSLQKEAEFSGYLEFAYRFSRKLGADREAEKLLTRVPGGFGSNEFETVQNIEYRSLYSNLISKSYEKDDANAVVFWIKKFGDRLQRELLVSSSMATGSNEGSLNDDRLFLYSDSQNIYIALQASKAIKVNRVPRRDVDQYLEEFYHGLKNFVRVDRYVQDLQALLINDEIRDLLFASGEPLEIVSLGYESLVPFDLFRLTTGALLGERRQIRFSIGGSRSFEASPRGESEKVDSFVMADDKGKEAMIVQRELKLGGGRSPIFYSGAPLASIGGVLGKEFQGRMLHIFSGGIGVGKIAEEWYKMLPLLMRAKHSGSDGVLVSIVRVNEYAAAMFTKRFLRYYLAGAGAGKAFKDTRERVHEAYGLAPQWALFRLY